MHIQRNISLRPYNTFGLDAVSEFFTEIHKPDELAAISTLKEWPNERHVIGGGSNILLTGDVSGLTILNRLAGIKITRENEEYIWIEAASGEIWHNLILYAIERGWGGIENLALIPGTVGAAPIQNIGAYGAEVKDVIETVNCWNWEQQQIESYTNEECNFGYRDSIFKHHLKDRVFITSVLFRLRKNPIYNISYGAIEQELEQMNVFSLSVKVIAEAVIRIRTSKLPNPAVTGNAGSFFKNPVISTTHYLSLKEQYPDIPSYKVNEQQVKVPAGWLIEKCGWKGYKSGDAGVHSKQALVLVNYNKATGKEIWQLSEKILQSINDRFNILLEREVQIW